jgi:predicted nucleic acid-binding protein
VLPEVDYLATKYLGSKAATIFLEDFAQGAFRDIAVELADLERAIQVINKYQDVPLGIVDASLVALAECYQIRQLLTLNRKHFSWIKPQKLDFLELLP